MINLERRIVQLEQGSVGAGRVVVIAGPNGYGIERALTELGVTRTDNDLVVYIRKMFESPAPLRLVRISATTFGR